MTGGELAKTLAEIRDDEETEWKELSAAEAEALNLPVNNRIRLYENEDEEEDDDEEDEEDEEEALAVAKIMEQRGAFDTYLLEKDGSKALVALSADRAAKDRAPKDGAGSLTSSAKARSETGSAEAEVETDGVEGTPVLVDAPATHASFDPQTKSPRAYQKPKDAPAQTAHLQGDATGSGSRIADVAAGTGVALGCMALVAMVALLYAPRKLQPSSSSQQDRNTPLVSSAREEAVEMGGVKSSWAANAVDQAVDAAQQTNP
jgi:hypothetical protein